MLTKLAGYLTVGAGQMKVRGLLDTKVQGRGFEVRGKLGTEVHYGSLHKMRGKLGTKVQRSAGKFGTLVRAHGRRCASEG